MSENRLQRYVLTSVALIVVSFIIAALVSPPDPFTQIIYAAPMIVLSLVLAYWLTYRDGYRRIRGTD